MAAPLFDRQRVVLALVTQSRRRPTRVHLLKWLFLLGEETAVREHIPFYDFLPYRYGPFSFTAYNEIGRLGTSGLVDDRLRVPDEQRDVVGTAVERLPSQVQSAIARVLAEYGALSPRQLVDSVYSRYPWFASRSRLRPKRAAPEAEPAVYTIGYESASIDGFLNRCLEARLHRIIDVRKNAYSQKYGFTGGPLRRMCGHVGLDYQHFPVLGIPSELRVDLSTREKRQQLFRLYQREILPAQPEAQDRVCDLLLAEPSALLCMERHHADCHRGTLATNLAAQTDLEIVHLQ